MSRVFRPQPGQFGFNIVLNEALSTTFSPVNVYIVDDRRVTAAQISALHASGRAVIAFFNAAASEDAPDEASLPGNVYGDKARIYSTDPCCPVRDWIDFTDSSVRTLMQQRVSRVAALGVDGVVWNGLPAVGEGSFAPTSQEITSYANFLVTITRNAKLAVGLGQSLDLVASLAASFDFAVVANCFIDGTCSKLAPFTSANKAVFAYELDSNVTPFVTCLSRGSIDLIVKGSDRDNLRNAPLSLCGSYSLANSAFLTTAAPTTVTPKLTTTATTRPTATPPGFTTARTTAPIATTTTATTAGDASIPHDDTLAPTPARSLFVAEQPQSSGVPPPSLALPIGLAIGAALIFIAIVAIAMFVCKKSRRDDVGGGGSRASSRRGTAVAQVQTLGPTEGTMATMSTASTGSELMRGFPRDGTAPTLEQGAYTSGAMSAVPAYDNLHMMATNQTSNQFGSWAPQPTARGYEIGAWQAGPPVGGTTGPLHLTNVAYSFDNNNNNTQQQPF